MGELIYSLCTLTSVACASVLYASYRRTGHRLLFWSGSCFAVLTVNNFLLLVDKVVLGDDISLLPARLVTQFVALVLLLYGLIYEKE